MPEFREAVIVAYGRTPCAKAKKGSFANLHPVEYGAQALSGVVGRVPGLAREAIGDVVVGRAMPFGVQGWNIARLLVHRAGFPDSVPAQTVNRFCSSGLQAIAIASNAIRAGEEDIVVAGGVETMSMVSMVPPPETFDPWLAEHRPAAYMGMGLTAENVAVRYGVTREDMDAMAVESHRKAAEAWAKGCFDAQIVPVTFERQDGERITLTRDEGLRPGTNTAALAALEPCFKDDGLVTAATSSQMTDGAAFVVMTSREMAAAIGVRPLARLIAFSARGVAPAVMGIGPIEAVPVALRKAGLAMSDIDTVELNEAFAAQALACIRELGIEPGKVNPWGGAMALGHPLGATGAMLACKAIAYLEREGKRYGLVSMCVGGGMGAAGVFERLC